MSYTELERTKLKIKQLESRLQLAENKKNYCERKKDTRRKILVGSYFLDQASQKGAMEDIKQKMATYLKRRSDRQLFDLDDNKR